jgi:alginate O-acetyltransferase complex protein AlgI
MEFNSISFLVFFAIVVVLYYNLSKRNRFILLLISSFLFYSFWNWKYSFLLVISGITDYYVSKKIYESTIKKEKLIYLTTSMIVNLGLLIYFKYLFFLTDNFNFLSESFGLGFNLDVLNIMLPFGISFYTFETISYSVDVYRGVLKPEKSFLKYALFVSFFPKLVAGPIQRANEFLPQLQNKVKFSTEILFEGLKRILFGLFLKVVFADNIAGFVDDAYSYDFALLSFVDLMTLGYLFGFQIYFDFSAYSHIAIGAAKCFGIDIPENFNFPYVSHSFKEFWKRWHISLSAWIKDYLYLPLLGVKISTSSAKSGIGNAIENKTSNRNYALFVTWIIMGFWHGANWNFAFWGLLHASFIFLERKIGIIWNNLNLPKTPHIIKWIITLNLVMFSWIPFRVNAIGDLKYMFIKLLSFSDFFELNLRENNYILVFVLLVFSIIYYLFMSSNNKLLVSVKNNLPLKIISYSVILFLTFIFLETKSQFIYFQF